MRLLGWEVRPMNAWRENSGYRAVLYPKEDLQRKRGFEGYDRGKGGVELVA